MKHQEVKVDFWAMGTSMLTYGALTFFFWIMIRLYSSVFTMPGRLRKQQQSIQDTLQELQRRFPKLDITEEDIKNADKELDELIKEMKDNKDKIKESTQNEDEHKKDI